MNQRIALSMMGNSFQILKILHKRLSKKGVKVWCGEEFYKLLLLFFKASEQFQDALHTPSKIHFLLKIFSIQIFS